MTSRSPYLEPEVGQAVEVRDMGGVFRRSLRLALALGVLCCLPASANRSDRRNGEAKGEARKEQPAALRRPSWGKVLGWVLDAETRKPIPGARVAVEVDGDFPEAGKSTTRSNPRGRFAARAPLGKISSKLDWGRILTMHPVSLLLSPRSVMKQTRILDVMQVNVRIEAEGYKPFLGRVRTTFMDPTDFSVMIQDVWLAPLKGPLVSFTPDRLRLEAVHELKVEPSIAEPGQKVKITLAARLPIDRGFKYRAYGTSTSVRLVRNRLELKRARGEPDPERVVFSREVTLPKNPTERWTEIGFFLVRDDDLLLRQGETRVLLQVVRTPEERKTAEKVAEGYARARAGDKEAGLAAHDMARRERPDYRLAHLLYGDLCLQLNRSRDAAVAFRQIVDLDPRDYQVARSRYALALIESGSPEEALAQLADAEKVLGSKRIPAQVFLYRARIYAAQGNFSEADKWLAKAGNGMQIPDEVQSEINLKRMEAAVKASTENPDLRLSYARVLQGARHREEAIVQMRKAAELDPGQPWAFIDLGTGLRQLGRHEEGMANLKHALDLAPDNPEALLALADAYRDAGRYAEALPLYRKVVEAQKLNLRARHHYALMLFATGNEADARKELMEVVNEAREKGDLKDEGLTLPGATLYFGPKRRLVYGFSVPEAAADVALLEALQELERHPREALLWQNVGSALLDLNLPALALSALHKSLEFNPNLLETRFLLGVAYRKRGEAEQARQELEAVVAANPLHPRARLELAQFYSDQGDLERALAQLIAHSKNYPHERPPRVTQSLGG